MTRARLWIVIAYAVALGAAVFFVLQRPDAHRIIAARRIDPLFAETLARAESAGVRVLGRRCAVSWEGIALGGPVPAGAG